MPESVLPQDERQICDHLAKVVASEALGGPTTLWSRLLFYSVQAQLQGTAHQLGEKQIAELALGRRPGFDPKLDRIVSVTKIKLLREKLPAYYQNEGRADRVRFSFPAKGFCPIIEVLPSTLSPAASLDYHRALRAYDDRSPQSMQSAVEALERVLSEAPDHAPALALAAEIYCTLANYGAPPQSVFPRAGACARRALTADPASWRAHIALGSVQASVHKDWSAAGALFARALQLAPHEVRCHPWYTAYLVSRGRAAEAIAGMEAEFTAREDLARLPTAQADRALMLMAGGEFSRARAIIDSLLTGHTPSPFFLLHLVMLELFERRFPEALAAADSLLRHTAGQAFQPGWRAFCLGAVGRTAEAAVLAQSLEAAIARGDHVPQEQLASALTGAGRLPDAVSALQRGLAAGEPLLLWAAVWPQFRPLHHLPEFQALLSPPGVLK